jgi:hypothetical protein
MATKTNRDQNASREKEYSAKAASDGDLRGVMLETQ